MLPRLRNATRAAPTGGAITLGLQRAAGWRPGSALCALRSVAAGLGAPSPRGRRSEQTWVKNLSALCGTE